MTKKTEGYAAAYDELQKILEAMDQGEIDVDELSEKVKRAAELIEFCQKRFARHRPSGQTGHAKIRRVHGKRGRGIGGEVFSLMQKGIDGFDYRFCLNFLEAELMVPAAKRAFVSDAGDAGNLVGLDHADLGAEGRREPWIGRPRQHHEGNAPQPTPHASGPIRW
jgi:exodeoxyribonuclease VII small subunit